MGRLNKSCTKKQKSQENRREAEKDQIHRNKVVRNQQTANTVNENIDPFGWNFFAFFICSNSDKIARLNRLFRVNTRKKTASGI